MPTTPKKVADEAVKKVKAVAEDAKAAVKTVVEPVAEKAEAPVEKTKTATKKAAAKPRQTAAKKPAVKKTTEKIEAKVVIELPNVSESTDSLIARAKADWTAKGNALSDIKQLALYINAAEGMVYYVVNDDYLSGNFAV